MARSPHDDDFATLRSRSTGTPGEAESAVASDERHAPELPNIPVIDATPAHPADVRPSWRGWIHAGTFPVAIVAGIVLVVLADGATAKWASAVFAMSSLLLFGMSALYHRFDWSPRTKVLLKRFDHSNIFLLIAGSYTPIALLALPPSKGIILLVAVWTGAVIGIGFRVFWIGAPRWLYVALYIGLGWAAMMYIVDILSANALSMVLVIIGGLLYTGGAVMYALKRPNPWPGHFGFHELFHVCTVIAFLCHWTAIFLLATNPVYNG